MKDQATQQALAHYNKHFDNQQYHAITQMLADDLKLERESVAASDAANLVTDAALGISDHPHYLEAWLTLAVFCARNNVQVATINHVSGYLKRFSIGWDQRADDFQAVAKSLRSSYVAGGVLKSAIASASEVHSWQGRTAYELLASAASLIQATSELLAHRASDLYLSEKLGQGIQSLIYALREGLRSSDQPRAFDFSETEFPEADQR